MSKIKDNLTSKKDSAILPKGWEVKYMLIAIMVLLVLQLVFWFLQTVEISTNYPGITFTEKYSMYDSFKDLDGYTYISIAVIALNAAAVAVSLIGMLKNTRFKPKKMYLQRLSSVLTLTAFLIMFFVISGESNLPNGLGGVGFNTLGILYLIILTAVIVLEFKIAGKVTKKEKE